MIHARNQIRSIKEANNGKIPAPGIVVYIVECETPYFSNILGEPILTLESQDSGDTDAPVIYSGYQNSNPILSAG